MLYPPMTKTKAAIESGESSIGANPVRSCCCKSGTSAGRGKNRGGTRFHSSQTSSEYVPALGQALPFQHAPQTRYVVSTAGISSATVFVLILALVTRITDTTTIALPIAM